MKENQEFFLPTLQIIIFQHLSVENKVHESFTGLLEKLDDSTREKWSSFVSGKLAEVNDRNTIVPHNSYSSNAMSSSEDEDTDFKDVTFPQESSLQQVRTKFIPTKGRFLKSWKLSIYDFQWFSFGMVGYSYS